MSDRQITRWQEARVRLHHAQQQLRSAQLEVDAASAEAVTAGAALAERVRLADASHRADMRRAA